MSPAIISLMFTAGASAWIYAKLMKYSGNNTKETLIALVVAAAIIFFIMFSILGLILN